MTRFQSSTIARGTTERIAYHRFLTATPTCERALPCSVIWPSSARPPEIQEMSYIRLLRLPPPSEAVGPYWRRQLSACSRNAGSSSPEHARTVSRRIRAHHHGLVREGGEGIPEEVGHRVLVGVDTSLVTAGVAEAVARRAGAACGSQAAAVRRSQTCFAHGEKALLRSRHRQPPSTCCGAAGTGWNYGSRGLGLQLQPLRAFASAPPDQAAKPNSTGPRQRDLLKPSDVSK